MLLLKHVVACQKDNPTTRIVLTTPESKPITKKSSNKTSPKIVKKGGRKPLKNSDTTNDSFDSINTENLATNEENLSNLKPKKNRKSTTKRKSELFKADNTTENKDIVENNAGNQPNKRRISKKIKPLNNVNTIEVQNKSAIMKIVDISNNERSYIGNHIADNNVQIENKTEEKTDKESLNNKEGNIFLASYININKLVIRYLKLLIVLVTFFSIRFFF